MHPKTASKIIQEITDKRFTALINLLEDENSDIASLAISELLSYGKKFEPIISELHESPNWLARQRSHQLQAIIKIRRSREKLIRRFNNKHAGLWQGLHELHLLWYDNDSSESLKELKTNLLVQAGKIKPGNAAELAKFMKEMTFVCTPSGDIESDYYCIGSVLDSKVGADFIVCSIAWIVASYLNIRCCIAYSKKDNFILVDDSNNRILPTTWKIKKTPANYQYDVWTSGMILKHTIFQLYLCAVSTDSYRYTYSIGLCLAKMLNIDDNKDLFPYPYNFIPKTN